MNGWFTSMGELPKVSRVIYVLPPQEEKAGISEAEELNIIVMPVVHLDPKLDSEI